MLFKELELKACFTCDELGNGIYRRISPKKFTLAKDDDDKNAAVIPSVNMEVKPWAAEDEAKHGPGAEIVEKFDPQALIDDLKKKSWRNYQVVNRDGEIIGTLGNLATDPTFLADAEIVWDANGQPSFSNHTFIYPKGAIEGEVSFQGFFEAAIPNVYKRRVIIFTAQGLTGFGLYTALVLANKGDITRHGGGVNRGAHLTLVKTKTRQQNRLKRADRKRNLWTLAQTSGKVRSFDHMRIAA